MCKHDPDLYKIYTPINPTYSTVSGIRMVKGGYSGPKMITELRMPWNGHGDMGHHPLSPLYANAHMNNDNCLIYCPFCNYGHEPDGRDFEADCQEIECGSCDLEFQFSAEFGSGFISFPIPCKNGAHHKVFCSQYAYKGEAVRIFNCIYCNDQTYHSFDHTLMPWLPEYDDPDTFDPEGTLSTGADLSQRLRTPVLDYLRKASSHSKYYKHRLGGADEALRKHNKYYGASI